MKKRLLKLIVMILLLVNMFPAFVIAAGNTIIDISNKNPKVGETFTVKVRGSESAKIKVEFDSRIISVVGSDVDISSTSNSVTYTAKNASITFEAKAEGTSGVLVSSDTLTGSSISVPVSGSSEAAAAPQDNQQPEATPEEETVNSEFDFSYEGINYVLSEKYTPEEIPMGFGEVEMQINGKTVKEISNGIMNLVYLKPVDNTEAAGEFYIYNAETNEIQKMELLGQPASYVILMPMGELFSQLLIEDVLVVDDRQYTAYRIDGSESEFYYVYGMGTNGVESWYAYDTLTGGIGRADTVSLGLIGAVEEEEEALVIEPDNERNKRFKISTAILVVLAVVFVILIIVTIIVNAIMKKKEADEEGYEYGDEYNNGDYSEDTETFDSDNDVKTYTIGDLQEKSEGEDTSLEDNKVDYIPERDESIVDRRSSESLYDGINSDQLIDDLIRKASSERFGDDAMTILDLDDDDDGDNE